MARRKNEIGIRVALGADRVKVVGLVLRGTASRVLVGLLRGVPLSIGAGRLISSKLYGVASWDPAALTVAAGALAMCAFLATLIPARNAASLAPMDALQTEQAAPSGSHNGLQCGFHAAPRAGGPYHRSNPQCD